MTATKTYYYTTTLTTLVCGDCHIPFAIPDNLYSARHSDGGAFYCPNGHHIHFLETDNERLQRQLKAERDRAASLLAQRDQAEASLRTTKGHVTRLRKKVLEGACPFCGQHVYGLARHISRQHPNEPEEQPEV